MNATHSHSAPVVDVRRDNEKRANDVEKYKDLVISRISEAVVNAWKARKPAGIAATSDFASAGHCRRAVYADGTAEMYGDTSRHDFIGMEGIKQEEEAFQDFCGQVKDNEKIPGRPGPYDSKLHHFVLIKNAKAVLARYEEQKTEPDFSMELHVLRLGDTVFASNPFELYLDYGHQIKARSKAPQTFMIQLACGRAGYLPTARAEQLGGYGGLIVNGVVGADGGRMLVDETVKEIEKLWT